MLLYNSIKLYVALLRTILTLRLVGRAFLIPFTVAVAISLLQGGVSHVLNGLGFAAAASLALALLALTGWGLLLVVRNVSQSAQLRSLLRSRAFDAEACFDVMRFR